MPSCVFLETGFFLQLSKSSSETFTNRLFVHGSSSLLRDAPANCFFFKDNESLFLFKPETEDCFEDLVDVDGFGSKELISQSVFLQDQIFRCCAHAHAHESRCVKNGLFSSQVE